MVFSAIHKYIVVVLCHSSIQCTNVSSMCKLSRDPAVLVQLTDTHPEVDTFPY